MLSVRMSTLSLCLVSLGFVGSSFADSQQEIHQSALAAVAMEQICNKNNPGLNGDVENVIASDPKFDEASKAEIRKVKSDPAYKFEVMGMVSNLNSSGMATIAQDMCKEYAPK